MVYQLKFFCRAGEETGASAMSNLLDRLLEHGPCEARKPASTVGGAA
ncbi:hypothetical protein [Actinomadura livida]|uniref:Uncharacterized protein n=1 Tax=Actinomadura livida TaxID=79909 RepID=A0A7W7N2B8_9ACTN|nr:hypothetical protein [Actinomadura catellatispora]